MVVVMTQDRAPDPEAYLPLAKRFVSQIGCDAGCLGAEVLVSKDEPNLFVFISKWEKESDFEAHRSSQRIKKRFTIPHPDFYTSKTEIYHVK